MDGSSPKDRKFLEDGLRGQMKGSGRTADELDAARKRNTAYEYLCHLEEAKKWIEACISEELPPASEMEGALRNGIILAKLAMFFAPDLIKEKQIYDFKGRVYEEKGLVFRHTDNINQLFKAMEEVKFPEIFWPEVTDIYDKKNMPRAIYCVHALSRFLSQKGIAPEMEDLHGIAEFTEEELSAMEQELQNANVQMPKFGKINGILAKELGVDDAAMHAAILKINQALEEELPTEELLPLLKAPAAQLTHIKEGQIEEYRDNLISDKMEKKMNAPDDSYLEESSEANNDQVDVYDTNLTKEEIQGCVSGVNKEVEKRQREAKIKAAIDELLEALSSSDKDKVLEMLKNPILGLKDVNDENIDEYMEELKKLDSIDNVKQLQEAVSTGNQVAEDKRSVGGAISRVLDAVRSQDAEAVIKALKDNQEQLELPDVDETQGQKYIEVLTPLAESETEVTADSLRSAVVQANSSIQHEKQVEEALNNINRAIENGDADETLKSLKQDVLGLVDVDDAGAVQYQYSLSIGRRDTGSDLNKDQIQTIIAQANKEAEDNAKHAAALFALNDAIRKGDEDETLSRLQDDSARVENIRPEVKDRYQKKLQSKLHRKEEGVGSRQTVWKQFKTSDGRIYYYNKETKSTQWSPPSESNETDLTLVEIQDCVNDCNGDDDRWKYLEGNSEKIIRLQALVRGMLAAKRFRDRMAYLRDNEASVVKVQSHVRKYQQQRRFKERLDYLNAQVTSAIKIQAAWKGLLARRRYENLTKVDNPPVGVVQRFVHLLDQSDKDFNEELQCQNMKKRVVMAIQNNHKLDAAINDMDIKIGLLVRNRIEIEDVVRQSKLLKKARKQGSNPSIRVSNRGLKSLTKDAREKLESYQHLFYLLQTNPVYLAKLVFIDNSLEDWTANKTSHFLQDAIQTVYNYASNNREEYLLLKLYRKALQTEVQQKVIQPRDISTGNPTVIRLVISQSRNQNTGYYATTIGPTVKFLMSNEELDLNTSPTDIYKRWINTQEQETGEKSSLPYDAPVEEVLKHDFVQKRVNETIDQVLKLAQDLLDSIIDNVQAIPYSLRYICNALQYDLRKKFPNVSDDEILKILGNVLYYRYINPAIIAPEGFDVIQGTSSETITPLVRRNLASLAKLLQFAAAGQQFEGEQNEKTNAFLVKAWARFRQFYVDAATVASSEDKFAIDEYSDVKMLTKPQIFISPYTIYYIHRMLKDNIDRILEDDTEDDPIKEILADLGDLGSEADELGEEESLELAHSKIPTTLVLSNKFEVPEDDDSSTRALFIKTKRLVVDVIRFQQGKSLKAILETPATDAMEEQHMAYQQKKRIDTKRQTRMAASKSESSSDEASTAEEEEESAILTLKETKEVLLENLARLEEEGLCSADNEYQELLNAVAQDIRNQRNYRKQRKAEVKKLQTTLDQLGEKKKFYEEQEERYNLYIGSCMEHMGKETTKRRGLLRRKTKAASSSEDGSQFFGTVKYSASKLKEKGVIISVDSLSDSQLRHVSIQISSQEKGVFEVRATFLGQNVEKEELLFQDLLQMQYENITQMKMFGLCTVNVNLMIFLINKKFYFK